MRINDLVQLNRRPKTLTNMQAFLLEQACGKSVLNVGAGGGVHYYLPSHPEQWMHAQLAQVAKSLDGLDLDANAVKHAAAHDWQITEGNCETVTMPRRYDMVLMSDVLEHVEQPPRAIRNLVAHLNPGGRLYLTTPNATFAGMVAKAILTGRASVYWDHIACYLPEHIQAICDRHGLELFDTIFFSTMDMQSTANRFKSHMLRALALASPRLHNSFLAVVGPKQKTGAE
jgi:SAM-dependent methyltransferase